MNKQILVLVLSFFVSSLVFAKAPVNKLTGKERRAGFELLFNGKDFTGWKGFRNGEIPNAWKIEENAIMITEAKGANGRKGGDIYFDQKYTNFELRFQWRVNKGSNSGVFYLGQIIPNVPFYLTAPEYQILDNENHPDSFKGKNGNRKSASLYDMMPADPQNSKPYGEWNDGAIVVKDGKVQHFQNGVKVVEVEIGIPEWETMVEHSKFKGTPMKQVGQAGYISLQDHGNDVWFRSIRVKSLDK